MSRNHDWLGCSEAMPTIPCELYHYTGGTGLLGIFSSDSIWTTNIQYLNDTREFSIARERAKYALASVRTDFQEGRPRQICDALQGAMQRLRRLPLYVACLSEIGDSLNQ